MRRSASRRSCGACTAGLLDPGEIAERSPVRGVAGAPRVRLARARLRAPPRHTGLPETAAARVELAGPRAAELLGPAHRRLRRPRGPRHRAAPRVRDEGSRRRHPRLPPARLPRRRPRLRPARADRQGQPLHRRRLQGAGALEARRQGLGQPEDAGARLISARWPGSSCSCTHSARHNRGSPTTSSTNGWNSSRASSPIARPRTSAPRSRP